MASVSIWVYYGLPLPVSTTHDGLTLLIVLFKILALRSKDVGYDEAARFWARIFGLNFAVGVATGIPLEFQFGTNWARFSNFSGGIGLRVGLFWWTGAMLLTIGYFVYLFHSFRGKVTLEHERHY